MAYRVWRLDALVQEPPSYLGAFLNALGCLFLVAVRGRPQGLPVLPWPGSPTRVQLPPYCLATIEW